eukprot:5998473-Lingulodinium_polyedra.AAC.1
MVRAMLASRVRGVSESFVSDVVGCSCSIVTVVGELPDGRWIEGGGVPWNIGLPTRGRPARQPSGVDAG